MKAEMFFKIYKDYDRTRYPILVHFEGKSFWDGKKYVWEFPFKYLKEVEAVLAEPIEIDGYDKVKEIFQIEAWKGKSGFDIIEFPLIFRLVEWRKSKTTGKVTELKHDVPKTTLDKVWKVMKTFPLNKNISFERIVEKICREFYLIRFFRQAGTFDKQKFEGSRSEGYFPFYYYPMKVLEAKGVVEIGSKTSKRISNEFEIQAKIIEKVLRSDEL